MRVSRSSKQSSERSACGVKDPKSKSNNAAAAPLRRRTVFGVATKMLSSSRRQYTPSVRTHVIEESSNNCSFARRDEKVFTANFHLRDARRILQHLRHFGGRNNL